MFAVRDDLLANFTKVEDAAAVTGFCLETFPKYIKSVGDFVNENVIYLVSNDHRSAVNRSSGMNALIVAFSCDARLERRYQLFSLI